MAFASTANPDLEDVEMSKFTPFRETVLGEAMHSIFDSGSKTFNELKARHLDPEAAEKRKALMERFMQAIMDMLRALWLLICRIFHAIPPRTGQLAKEDQLIRAGQVEAGRQAMRNAMGPAPEARFDGRMNEPQPVAPGNQARPGLGHSPISVPTQPSPTPQAEQPMAEAAAAAPKTKPERDLGWLDSVSEQDVLDEAKARGMDETQAQALVAMLPAVREVTNGFRDIERLDEAVGAMESSKVQQAIAQMLSPSLAKAKESLAQIERTFHDGLSAILEEEGYPEAVRESLIQALVSGLPQLLGQHLLPQAVGQRVDGYLDEKMSMVQKHLSARAYTGAVSQLLDEQGGFFDQEKTKAVEDRPSGLKAPYTRFGVASSENVDDVTLNDGPGVNRPGHSH